MVCKSLQLKFDRKLSESRLSDIERLGNNGKEPIDIKLLTELVEHYHSNIEWVVYGPCGGMNQPIAAEDKRIDRKALARLEKIRLLKREHIETIDVLIAHLGSKDRQ